MTNFSRLFTMSAVLLIGVLCTSTIACAQPNATTQESRRQDSRRVVYTINLPDTRTTLAGNVDLTTLDAGVQLSPYDYAIRGEGFRIEKTGFGGDRIGKFVLAGEYSRAKSLDLYVFHGPGEAAFNGQPITFERLDHGNWYAAHVPADRVRKGKGANTLTFRAGWSLGMDLDETPARSSSISEDGGKTFKPAPAEFYVHVRAEQFAPAGAVVSPVIELAAPDDEDIVRPMIDVDAIKLSMDVDQPVGTQTRLEVRTGQSRDLNDGTWTEWSTALGDWPIKPAPVVQWRVLLGTANARQSPVVRSVTITADVRVVHDAPNVKVVMSDQPRIAKSSYDFTWQPPSDRLKQLRETYKLDDVIAAGETEFDQFVLLRQWVRKQWPHNDMGSGVRTWDALEILGAPENMKGMCVHFGVTYTQCALALGFNARQIILDGHYVSEIWSNEHQKWVLMDVETTNSEGWNRYGTAHYVDAESGVPLNGWELNKRIVNGLASSIIQKLDMTNDAGVYKTHDRQYDAAGLAFFRRVAWPLRNNYLDQLEPWEEFHGQDHYRSNAYIWASHDAAGNTPEYSRRTTREEDINWTVNQVRIRLYATDDPNRVRTVSEVYQPNFAYLYYPTSVPPSNDQPWMRVPTTVAKEAGLAPSFISIVYGLRSAQQRYIVVRPSNTFGRPGVPSTVQFEINANPK